MSHRLLARIGLVGALLAVGFTVSAKQAQSGGDPVKQLLDTKACAGCFLAEAALSAASLEGANLAGANLFEAKLYMANLEKSTLVGAQLGKANLRKARLKGANLSGADLTGADLTMALDVDFEGATTTSATICPDGTTGPCR